MAMCRRKTVAVALFGLSCCIAPSLAFTTPNRHAVTYPSLSLRPNHYTTLKASSADEEEEQRLEILASRRRIIRKTLKNAEESKFSQIENGLVPEIDPETGKPIKKDSKAALTITAFVVAAGAVTLRVGGRAALVSAVGLDFANENPELKENMDKFLGYASSLDMGLEALLFILAWTAVKVFCFDAGGVVLALSSGILFGGVLQGAFFSAFAATVGSSAAYFLAKVDSPARKKALELLEEYPSLRGIEKVVAEDGLKAILTLRLAPILPIPIGLYNYIYGVTNVPFLDFAAGIFLGSFKPYLLDSYLGVFGKEVVDGTLGEGGGLQDIILLVVLGVSVLIGVFASELAAETWDSVKEEVEEEKRKQKEEGADNGKDGITRSLLGFDLPQWVIGAQISLKEASERMDAMIMTEYSAQVWNYTDDNPPPSFIDPAQAISSPEVQMRGKGFDGVASICDGMVLSPALFKAYFKYADPLFNETEVIPEINYDKLRIAEDTSASPETVDEDFSVDIGYAQIASMQATKTVTFNAEEEEKKIQESLDLLRNKIEEKLEVINKS